MNILSAEFFKYAIAIITLIIQIVAVRSGWVFPKDKIFTSRKISVNSPPHCTKIVTTPICNGSHTNMVSPR